SLEEDEHDTDSDTDDDVFAALGLGVDTEPIEPQEVPVTRPTGTDALPTPVPAPAPISAAAPVAAAQPRPSVPPAAPPAAPRTAPLVAPEPADDYEKISVTGGEGDKRRLLPWIIVGAGVIVALIAALLIVNSLSGSE